MANSDRARRTLFRPTGEGHQVTTLELFFDLVFVFALTQVTAFLAEDVSLRQALRGLVLLALLWFAWCSYAWLGNQAKADEGAVRAGMVTAMGAVFVAALALPEAWDDEGDGVSAPLVAAVALAAAAPHRRLTGSGARAGGPGTAPAAHGAPTGHRIPADFPTGTGLPELPNMPRSGLRGPASVCSVPHAVAVVSCRGR